MLCKIHFSLDKLDRENKTVEKTKKNQSESISVWIEERGVPRIEPRDAEMFYMAFSPGIRNGEKKSDY